MSVLGTDYAWLGGGSESCQDLLEARNLCLGRARIWNAVAVDAVTTQDLLLEMDFTLPIFFYGWGICGVLLHAVSQDAEELWCTCYKHHHWSRTQSESNFFWSSVRQASHMDLHALKIARSMGEDDTSEDQSLWMMLSLSCWEHRRTGMTCHLHNESHSHRSYFA